MSFMDKYLDKFPYFMNKDSESNNYKHHEITGSQLQQAKQILKSLEFDKDIVKPIQIVRVQENDFDYNIVFIINVDIDTIVFMKDDEPIDPVELETGLYIYSDTSETIIPENKFSCTVKTPDEEVWSHGIPENDTIQHNEFDHDYSLDQIGNLLGVKRLTYLQVQPSDYPYTRPPYNNQTIESDYEYSERLREFCRNVHKKPLPLLYLEAWLSVEGVLINRERELCKMSPGDMYGNLPEGDAPLPWEHRDLMCIGTGVEDSLFVFTVNTRRPLANATLQFKFDFMDTLWNKINVDGVIVPYIDGNNNNIGVLDSNESWNVVASALGDEDYMVRFKYFNSVAEAETELEDSEGYFVEDGLFTEEYLFTTISCTNADIYVATTGSDETGDGSSDNPYKTIKYGVGKTIMNDTVSVASGSYTEELISVKNSINLITCGTASIATEGSTFMAVAPNKAILIDGIGFQSAGETTTLENTTFRSNCNKEVYIVKTGTHEPIDATAVAGEAIAGYAVVGTGED